MTRKFRGRGVRIDAWTERRTLDGPVTRRDQLPLEAVRDLLGIVRSLYAAEKRAGSSQAHLDELADIGRMLANALDLAGRTGPDTVGHRAAWTRAEHATARLTRLLTFEMSAGPLVRAAAERLIVRKISR
jgi:hypothetical protein